MKGWQQYGLGLLVGLLPAVVYLVLMLFVMGPFFCVNQKLDVQVYETGIPLSCIVTFLIVLVVGIKSYKPARVLSYGIFTLLGILLVASYAFFLVWMMASLALWATPCR